MHYIDMHSHWKTERGYALREGRQLALQQHTWRSETAYASEQQQADDFRAANVRVILDFGFTKYIPVDEARELHDYAFETQRNFADVIIGNWVHFQPEVGRPALKEFERCLSVGSGLVGLAVSGSGGVPASDPAYDHFYRTCIDANIPALIFVGTTGLGSGMPGGDGIILDHCHPRHLDNVAARYPQLKIMAARPAWPWQTEMIAVLVHKANVCCELHGWSPKYFSDDLKYEIPRRLQNRILFGADYPLFDYERIINDWQDLGYKDEIYDKVFHGNAETILASWGKADGS